MYGFIYETTNDINGKKYIGQKKYDKQGNWKSYLGSGVILQKAIEKHGAENFSKRIIEECQSKEDLDIKEIYWINFYDAVNSRNYYNIASGGDGGNTIAGYTESQLRKYKLKRKLINSKYLMPGEDSYGNTLLNKDVQVIISLLHDNKTSSREIGEMFKVKSSTIDDIYFHRTWKHLTDDIIFPIRDGKTNRKKTNKKIKQYSLQGENLKTYESAREVEKITGISYKQISQACNGLKKVVHGYVWRFMGDEFDKYQITSAYYYKIS